MCNHSASGLVFSTVSSSLPIIFLRNSLFPRVSRRKMAFRRHQILFAIRILESSHEFSHLQLQTQARPPFIQTHFHVWLTDSSTRYPTYPLCEVNGFSLTKCRKREDTYLELIWSSFRFELTNAQAPLIEQLWRK